jgi:outer membrane protein assembly factor BamB
VAVDAGTAYFAAGIFPHEGAYLCAVNAQTGQRSARHHWQQFILNQASLQGYLLLSASRVLAPGARSNPWYFDRRTGKLLGQYRDREAAGTFTLLSSNSLFFGSAGRSLGQIREADMRGTNLMAYPEANALLLTADRIYLLTDTRLRAMDRASRKPIWGQASRHPHALILAGATLFAGGDNEVAAFDAENGKALWTGAAQGRVLGLAVASGHLFASTDEGFVHAFAEERPSAKEPSKEQTP